MVIKGRHKPTVSKAFAKIGKFKIMTPPKHIQEYREPQLVQTIVDEIKSNSQKPLRLMEVCGTHTMAIFRNGIRTLLPDPLTLLSGPGCPVCVTSQNDIDAFIALARIKDTIITTFGDLMRVPGTTSSLQLERAQGKDIRVVYSAVDALNIARDNPDKRIIFLGVGFETTAPTIAASLLMAREMGLRNYHVFCAHKLVPPALEALMQMDGIRVDGFILPGHVSVIIGTSAFRAFFERFQIPSVIAGFEPADLLKAIAILVRQLESGAPELVNAYSRAVNWEGNAKARQMMAQVFQPVDANWRGIGCIPQSGLKINEAYASFDAERQFEIPAYDTQEPKGCICGEILTGVKTPPQCPLYQKRCTPTSPVGACMVSSEGSCAAYYRYAG